MPMMPNKFKLKPNVRGYVYKYAYDRFWKTKKHDGVHPFFFAELMAVRDAVAVRRCINQLIMDGFYPIEGENMKLSNFGKRTVSKKELFRDAQKTWTQILRTILDKMDIKKGDNHGRDNSRNY